MKGLRVSLQEGIAVMAIVGVLGVVVAPVIAQNSDSSASIQKTQETACAENLKSLALGLAMYCQDYDEHFPSGANWHGTGAGWAQQIYPYLKSTALFHCPSDSNKNDVVSYAYNSNMVRLIRNPPAAPIGRRLEEMGNASMSLSLFEVTNNSGDSPNTYSLFYDSGAAIMDDHRTGDLDESWDGFSPGGRGKGTSDDLSGMGARTTDRAPLAYATGAMNGSDPESSAFQSGPRHNGGANYAFIDSHVKWIKPDGVSAGYNNNIPGNCGTATRAANTSCSNSSMGATFSIY
jgi:prepilin-type processing-associated H-X9-DG protein